MKDKIISMLVAGVRPVNISAAVGCDESYISQVAKDNHDDILAARAGRTADHIEHDLTLDTTEDRALQKVGRLLDTVTDPMKAIAVFKVLNAAKRRHESLMNEQAAGDVVELELPEMAKVSIRMTTTKQVIEIEGRSMLPMQSQNVEKMLAQRKKEKAEAVELLEDVSHVGNYVAPATMSLLAQL